MQSSNHLTVDLEAILHNIKQLTTCCGQVMVMVKANAYGTDPLRLCKFLQNQQVAGIPFFGVSHVQEGIKLREEGIEHPIFVISAPPHEAEWVALHHLTPAVSSFEELEALNSAAKKLNQRLSVHLHLNTGMNRFGISLEEAHRFYWAIKQSPYLHLEGIMTHFVAAEAEEFDPFTQEQIRQFKTFLFSLPSLPKWIHAANSAGAVRFPLPFCNLVRIGLGFVGCGVSLEDSKPALTLTSLLSAVSYSKKDESVGYNRTYTITKEKERIGVIPFGYHDGFHRSLSGKGYVLIHGKKAPMIGTICMDFMMVDLTEIPEASVGDPVTLFGADLPVETLATWANTDTREILSGLSSRVKRIWTNIPITHLNKVK